MSEFFAFYFLFGLCQAFPIAYDEWSSWKTMASSKVVSFFYPFVILVFWGPIVVFMFIWVLYEIVADRFRKNEDRLFPKKEHAHG